jgi:hypothetical protein
VFRPGKFVFLIRVRDSIPFDLESTDQSFSNDYLAINPLELTRLATFTDGNTQYTVCTSAFRPQLSSTGSDMDFLLGDIFMRNVYSVLVLSIDMNPPWH